MKRSEGLFVIVAAALFIVAHFLPSFAGHSGFQCERVCWEQLFTDPLDTFYTAAFALDNLIFVALGGLAFSPFRLPRAAVVLAGLSLLHVLSWLFLNLAWLMQGQESKFNIQAGYFLWALSFGLLYWAMCIRLGQLPTLGESARGPG